MDIGTAAAVKEAGLTGKVFVATSGGGERKGACELVKTGALDLDMSYDVPTQAAQMAGMIKWLISSGVKAGLDQGVVLHDADPDHQSQRRQRDCVLESQRSEEIAVSSTALGADRRAPSQPSRTSFPANLSALDARNPHPLAIPLLAGSFSRRDLIEALDRNRNPGHRPLDRRLRAEPLDRQLPVAVEPGGHRPSGGRDRLHRARRGSRRDRRRHRPFGRIDVRADGFLRALYARRSGLAGRCGRRRHHRLRRASRR